MGRIDAVISDETEKMIREFVRRKGDLSRMVEEGLTLWLNRNKK